MSSSVLNEKEIDQDCQVIQFCFLVRCITLHFINFKDILAWNWVVCPTIAWCTDQILLSNKSKSAQNNP